MMISVAELLDDPDFVQTLTVDRQTVQIETIGDAAGEAVVTHAALTIKAAVTPLNAPNDLALLPEGARSFKNNIFYSKTRLYADDGDDGTGTTPLTVDVIQYGAERYKVAAVVDYADYGYWKALAVIDLRPAAP